MCPRNILEKPQSSPLHGDRRVLNVYMDKYYVTYHNKYITRVGLLSDDELIRTSLIEDGYARDQEDLEEVFIRDIEKGFFIEIKPSVSLNIR